MGPRMCLAPPPHNAPVQGRPGGPGVRGGTYIHFNCEKVRRAEGSRQTRRLCRWITGDLVHGSEWVTQQSPLFPFFSSRAWIHAGAWHQFIRRKYHSSAVELTVDMTSPRRPHRPCLIPHRPLRREPSSPSVWSILYQCKLKWQSQSN